MNFHSSVPIFNVQDLKASRKYYIERLGFRQDWDYEDIVCSISRGNCSIMLVQQDQGRGGAWVWIGVGDTEHLHEELATSGANIRQGPTNFPWALEMQVEDLDGNVIRFGSDSLAGKPYGPWKDMHGRLST
ncbi:glyoxalase superfamily protein [Pontibacter sp. G13]|uniref:glyoxalase superfamily protein n=1 Tax=Pontibacter sp. G13 TaxID=3074898 RepID=UPI00288BFE1D|nr:glyoxalase superfamily protein [Pontibacter sp. G13]WNJ19367.1 glyoxalase superfamily protein [Pontibacter sp. G13]